VPGRARFLDSAQLAQLRSEQDDVLSRAQASEHGIDHRTIRRRVAADQWQTVGPAVVVLHNGPLSIQQQRWAGVLHAGAGAALAGLTALQAAGLDGFETDVIHVVVAHGQGRRHLVDERIHVAVRESTHLEPDQVLGVRKPPTQRQHRAAVDAASQARSEGSCRAVLAAAVQQRLVTSADLLAVVRRFPTLPRRALILETIGDVGGGAHSLPELEWNDGIRRARLPAPTRQRKVRHANGHFYLDADFDEWLVTVEINGAQHLTATSRDLDDERRFQLSARGRLVVDIASHVVRRDNARAVLRTARALHSRGWRPGPPVERRLHRMAEARREPLWLPPLAV
jgi:very-short-patch-repair endonuclease